MNKITEPRHDLHVFIRARIYDPLQEIAKDEGRRVTNVIEDAMQMYIDSKKESL